MGRVMAVTLNLLRLRYKFIFCTRQTTAHSSPCLSWESLPTYKALPCGGFLFHNPCKIKKTITKCHCLFYGAGDGLQLEPEPNIYSEIIKELVHSSTVIFDIKTVLKYLNTN